MNVGDLINELQTLEAGAECAVVLMPMKDLDRLQKEKEALESKVEHLEGKLWDVFHRLESTARVDHARAEQLEKLAQEIKPA